MGWTCQIFTQAGGGPCSVDKVTWHTIEMNGYFPPYNSERRNMSYAKFQPIGVDSAGQGHPIKFDPNSTFA